MFSIHYKYSISHLLIESICISSLLVWIPINMFKTNIKHAYYYYYTSQTITITITFPLLLHLLLLLNQRNTTQAIFKGLYYLHCITHYHRHIITDNIILKLSWKFCGVILSNRESNSLLLANVATYYYYYYYYR